MIGILGPGGCGGTFLDWTLHFLSDNKQSLVIDFDNGQPGHRQFQTQTITSTPLTSINSHQHKKNHPNDFTVDECIQLLNQDQLHVLKTFYYVDSMSPNRTRTNHGQIIEKNQNIKFIKFMFDPDDVDYVFCLQTEKIQNQLKRLKKETNCENSSVWDTREQLSLYYSKCVSNQLIDTDQSGSSHVYGFKFKHMINCLPQYIFDIMMHCELTVNPIKLSEWELIYHKWQQTNSTEFFRDINIVVSHIVNGTDLDLNQYNMSLAKEIVVAKKLLFDHNLCLKSNDITEIEKNTLAWHALLEPNVYHNLNCN